MLVTFVIFLVGIVSILRLFPGGFLSMRHTEDTTLAHRLAQTEIERWEGKTANLPSGILPWGEIFGAAGVNVILTDVDPSNLGDPLLPGGYYFSDVNKFRRVIGESTQIPMPLPDNSASIYVLSFSPIVWSIASPNPDPITIYGGELSRKPFQSNPDNLLFKQYGEYAIDYGKAQLYVKPFATDRWFAITYSYWQESGGKMVLYPAVGVSVFVPAANLQQTDVGYQIVDIPVDPIGNLVSAVLDFNSIDQGSDSLHRQFQEVAGWSGTDPYEFKMVNPVGGVIAFNPLGYGYTELTSRGKEPLTANMDYTLLDWHIIREERKLPDIFRSAADQDVKLTLRFIKKKGETMEQDGSTYAGLASEPPYSAAGTPAIPYDVLAVDVDEGKVYNELSTIDYVWEWDNSRKSYKRKSTDLRPCFSVYSYKNGIIRFDPQFQEIYESASNHDPNAPFGDPCSPFQRKTFRIYYRAEGDWALQPYKAYEVYRRSYTPSLDHRQYYYADGKIYFPRCYAGCTVAVDYSYRRNGETFDRFVTGEAYQISEDRLIPTGGTLLYCYIDVLKQLRTAHPGSAIDPDTFMGRIAKVYGVSIGTRVIWHETGRRLQAGAWRKVDLQTYLTRVSE